MHPRFRQGTIADFKAGEDIKNNDIYILDSATREIRKAKNCDEWLTCQLVYVYNYSLIDMESNNDIKKGTLCRCWLGHLVL